MKNLLLYFLLCCSTILVPSCKDKYHITGTAYDGEVADGAQIHIKQEINGEWHTLNSCEILHGNFCMEGDVDTTLLTALFIDDIPTQPLVLEGGKIEVSIQPQIIRITSCLVVAHPFQKWSNERTKLDLWVSIQGNSSIKISFLPSAGSVDIKLPSKRNASFQVFGIAVRFIPAAYNDSLNSFSCSFIEAL